jgi:hypothetical protein
VLVYGYLRFFAFRSLSDIDRIWKGALEDRARRRYVRRYFNAKIDDPTLYYVTLNTGRFGFARAAEARRADGVATPSRFCRTRPTNRQYGEFRSIRVIVFEAPLLVTLLLASRSSFDFTMIFVDLIQLYSSGACVAHSVSAEPPLKMT